MNEKQQYILIIKHGALGDIVMATGAMKAIRSHYPQAHITLLTTKTYASLFKPCPWVNEIWIDSKPKPWHLIRMLKLWQALKSKPFECVYDLQTSSRSSYYFKLFSDPKPEWSGIVEKGSHFNNMPNRTSQHVMDQRKAQLEIAGIHEMPSADVSWLTSETFKTQFSEQSIMLFIPGGSAHRPEKRWPVEQFIALAEWATEQKMTPVLIGTQAEADLLEAIAAEVPTAVNLCNQTTFADIAELGRQAEYTVGNDTGPMHLIAATGCKSIVLFSHASNPALCAPRGEHVTVLREPKLADLAVTKVIEALQT